MIEQIIGSLSLIILTVALYAAARLILRLRTNLRLRNPHTERIAEAALMTKLIPRFNAFIAAGSELFIVGGDGLYTQKMRGEEFISSLEEWLNKGCKISYVLVCPHANSASRLQALASRQPSFALYLMPPSDTLAPALQDTVQKYRTFHPVLLQTKDGRRVMWIEHYHPPDSEMAFNIEFIAPAEAAGDARFDEYKNDIELIQQACAKEKQQASLEHAA